MRNFKLKANLRFLTTLRAFSFQILVIIMSYRLSTSAMVNLLTWKFINFTTMEYNQFVKVFPFPTVAQNQDNFWKPRWAIYLDTIAVFIPRWSLRSDKKCILRILRRNQHLQRKYNYTWKVWITKFSNFMHKD